MAEDMDIRYQRALDRRLAGFNKIAAQQREDKLLRGKTSEEKERFAREQAAQAKRDERLNLYDVQGTNQRAGIAADAAYNQQGYAMQRDKQQTMDQLKRDAAQQGYTLHRDDRQFGQQMQRDAVQQGYGVQNDDRQFGQQLKRDAVQQGYGIQNDERQFGQQVQRDVMQDTFSSRRDQSQHRNSLESDQQQFGFQAQRDERLNQFDSQRDERQQGYTQQNAIQRETFDITAKWQDQIQRAREAGLDFSPDQKKEIQQLNRVFSQKVLNNPKLDEGIKQKAGLILQQKLLGIIPDEKVQKPQEQFQQSLFFDERVPGVPFMMQYDNQGRPTWEPLGSGGSGERQKEDPKIAMQRDAMFKREDEFLKIRDKIAAKADPETGELLYSEEEIDKLAMDEFAPKEAHYRALYDLPPQANYQKEADIERQKMEEKQLRNPQRHSQYDVNRPQPQQQSQIQANEQPVIQQRVPGGQQQPPTKPKPVTISSTNFDDQLKTVMGSGDQAVATALLMLKEINKKFQGAPPEGSQEFHDMMRALVFLRDKGVAFQPGKKKPKAKPVLEYNFPN